MNNPFLLLHFDAKCAICYLVFFVWYWWSIILNLYRNLLSIYLLVPKQTLNASSIVYFGNIELFYIVNMHLHKIIQVSKKIISAIISMIFLDFLRIMSQNRNQLVLYLPYIFFYYCNYNYNWLIYYLWIFPPYILLFISRTWNLPSAKYNDESFLSTPTITNFLICR